MAAPYCTWIALLFLTAIAGFRGSQCRTLQGQASQPLSLTEGHGNLKLDTAPKRWRRESLEIQREHCALLGAPWKETKLHVKDRGHTYKLKVLSLPEGGPSRAVFPEQPLFGFVRRVYRCCQMGFHCRSIKGIQGQLNGDSEVQFLLSADVLSASVVRAEVHFHISNPLHLRVEPWLPSMAKHKHPTRYSVWSKGGVLELRVDLLFLFQSLQEAIGGTRGGPSLVDLRRVRGLARNGGSSLKGGQDSQSFQDTDVWGEGEGLLLSALELGLVLHCTSDGGGGVPCEDNGVHLLHAPFIALSYR